MVGGIHDAERRQDLGHPVNGEQADVEALREVVHAREHRREHRKAKRVVAVVVLRRRLREEDRHCAVNPRDGAAPASHLVPEGVSPEALDDRDGAAGPEHGVDRDVGSAVKHRRADEETVVAADAGLVERHLAHAVVELVRPPDRLRHARRTRGEEHRAVLPPLDGLVEPRRVVGRFVEKVVPGDHLDPGRRDDVLRPPARRGGEAAAARGRRAAERALHGRSAARWRGG